MKCLQIAVFRVTIRRDGNSFPGVPVFYHQATHKHFMLKGVCECMLVVSRNSIVTNCCFYLGMDVRFCLLLKRGFLLTREICII